MSAPKKLKTLGQIKPTGKKPGIIATGRASAPSKEEIAIAAAALKEARLQEIADFAAAGCIPLKAGICLALDTLPRRRAGGVELPPGTLAERTHRTALLWLATRAGNIGSRKSADADGDGDVLVEPKELFTWLKSYLKGLPDDLDDWLVKSCQGVDAEEEVVPSRQEKGSRETIQGRHLKTARKLLALFVLMHHSKDLVGEKASWGFLPKNRQNAAEPVPGLDPLAVADHKTMKAHIANGIELLLLGNDLAAQYPDVIRLANHEKALRSP